MIIDFSRMDVTVLPNFKGGEKEFAANMFFDGTNRIFKGVLVPGATIGMHTHVTSSEVIYVLSGEGKMYMGDEVETLTAGDCHYCPLGQSHSFVNESQEDLVFFAVVPEQAAN